MITWYLSDKFFVLFVLTLFYECFWWNFVLLVEFGKHKTSSLEIPICLFQASGREGKKQKNTFHQFIIMQLHFKFVMSLTFDWIPCSFDWVVPLLRSFAVWTHRLVVNLCLVRWLALERLALVLVLSSPVLERSAWKQFSLEPSSAGSRAEYHFLYKSLHWLAR